MAAATAERRAAGAEVALENPYAGRDRKPLGHRVFERQARRLAELADGLQADGYKASAAELLQAILHFHTPEDATAAADLVGEFAGLSDLGGPDDPYAGENQVNLGHRVFEQLHDRLGELEAEMRSEGYAPRPYNQAQLTRAILHFHTPADGDEALELLRRWVKLKRGRPASK